MITVIADFTLQKIIPKHAVLCAPLPTASSHSMLNRTRTKDIALTRGVVGCWRWTLWLVRRLLLFAFPSPSGSEAPQAIPVPQSDLRVIPFAQMGCTDDGIHGNYFLQGKIGFPLFWCIARGCKRLHGCTRVVDKRSARKMRDKNKNIFYI